MAKVSATIFRKHLFDFLTRVERGETITVQKNGEDIAVISPVKSQDWRDKIKIRPRLLVGSHEAFSPMEDVFNPVEKAPQRSF